MLSLHCKAPQSSEDTQWWHPHWGFSYFMGWGHLKHINRARLCFGSRKALNQSYLILCNKSALFVFKASWFGKAKCQWTQNRRKNTFCKSLFCCHLASPTDFYPMLVRRGVKWYSLMCQYLMLLEYWSCFMRKKAALF